jgi:hypothetical protein
VESTPRKVSSTKTIRRFVGTKQRPTDFRGPPPLENAATPTRPVTIVARIGEPHQQRINNEPTTNRIDNESTTNRIDNEPHQARTASSRRRRSKWTASSRRRRSKCLDHAVLTSS